MEQDLSGGVTLKKDEGAGSGGGRRGVVGADGGGGFGGNRNELGRSRNDVENCHPEDDEG